ncbi:MULTISPECIES: TolC family protein [unclassified Roseateles]|uniref:TolC family protein n=1 Tax=unclassified Roseateles TaxID=2626991 RepID=UPI0006F41B01|nr:MULTISPECIES: TolC family protein [unclassified Roseateles]KQW42265.1 RND transporter [Pelomonas sp. Root405]KRA68138.1 RND transporter [Pelomonas sp. Root662]
MKRSRLPLSLLAVAMLAGCASVEPGASLNQVRSLTQAHTAPALTVDRSAEDLARTHAKVTELLRQPIGADTAVQIALLNNRGLQARLQQLGITEAEVSQAARLPNPGFSFGRLTQGDEIELERALHVNLARLLTLPLVSRLEERRLQAVQREVAMDVLSLAADARKAWVQAVAARESLRYMHQVQEAAEASAELARRMQQAGNFNALTRLREQGFYADAALGLARAEQRQRAARERLARLLGLWGDQLDFKLPERLPDLPDAPRDQPDIERQALAQRLDVQAARLAAEQTARNLRLTEVTRFVSVFELGLVRNTSNEAPRQTGWEVSLELPLFDWGGARAAKAESLYMQSLHQAAATAINARSEVREAYGNYRASYDIARHHRDEIVPLRKRISEEQLLRYNGMLIGVFELLADARSQVASVNASIEALRDFWLAKADLDMALIGRATLPMPAAAAVSAGGEAGAGH